MVKVEQAVAAGVLVLRFRNGSWRALPVGTEIDLLIQVLRADPAQPVKTGLIRSFARSVPQEDEGELMRLVRDIAKSFRSDRVSPPTVGRDAPHADAQP
jgi:hypothetical protein